MRLLVLCPNCERQYDASGRPIGSSFHCQCGHVVTIQQPQGHDAAVVRCSSCGAPRKEGSASCRHCGADFTLHERDLDTVCPHCLARISDQAQFCHHCGRPLLPESILVEGSALLCPACGEGHTLTSRRMADVNALECGRCTGVWLGNETLRLLVQRAASEGLNTRPTLPKQGPPPLPSDLPRDMPPLPKRVYRPCPFCSKLMVRQSFGQHSSIVVDRCGAHGFWFDEHELPRSLAWVRSGGFVQLNVHRAISAREEEVRQRTPVRDDDVERSDAELDTGGFLDTDTGWVNLLIDGLFQLSSWR